MNYLLIGVVIFFFLVTFNGWKRGLIRSVFFFGTTILALLLSSQCYQFVGKGINEYTSWDTEIKKSIENSLQWKGQEEQELKRVEQTEKIEELNLPKSIKEGLIENNNYDIYEALEATGFYDYVSSYLTKMVINAIAFIITFLGTGIIIRILFKVLDFITEIPILREINTIGGLLLGAIEALIGIWLFFLIITILGSTSFGMTMYGYINDSILLTYLYNNNILLLVITNMSKVLF